MINSPTAALWVIQKSIYAQLRGSDVLRQIMGDPVRVYDDPPPESNFPYITIGEARTEPFEGIEDAMEHDISLHVYSKYSGRREMKLIIDGIYETLHESDFTISEQCLVNIRFVFADMFRKSDGSVFQGVIRFRVVTQPELVA